MVRIRLRRMGAKKKPFYRIVVADKRSPRDGRFIETIGTYDPMTEPATVELQLDRAAHWLSVGAQPTEALVLILKSKNLLDEDGKPIPFAEEVVEVVEDVVAVVETEDAVEVVEIEEVVEVTEEVAEEATA
jgi:small subunit ribosomal protein S16